MDRKALGKKIRAIRTKKGFSQSDLAERLNVSYQQIQKYESGKSSISLDRLVDISTALEVRPEALLVEENAKGYGTDLPFLSLSPEERRIIDLLRSIDNRQVIAGLITQLEGVMREINESKNG